MDEIEINEEIERKRLEELLYNKEEENEDAKASASVEKEEKPKRKYNGTRESVLKALQVRVNKSNERKRIKEENEMKLKFIQQTKQDEIDLEYEKALKIKEKLEKCREKDAKASVSARKQKEINEEMEEEPEKKLIKETSKEILKQKYLEEMKKRVMYDLFS